MVLTERLACTKCCLVQVVATRGLCPHNCALLRAAVPQMPADDRPAKRARPDNDIAVPVPSETDYNDYTRLQGSDTHGKQREGTAPAFLNFCPPYAQPFPLQLLHPCFGQFQDIAAGRDAENVPSHQDHTFLLQLSHAVCGVYPSDEHRQVWPFNMLSLDLLRQSRNYLVFPSNLSSPPTASQQEHHLHGVVLS